jgi:type IV fimbrial biogenesis protein FimT
MAPGARPRTLTFTAAADVALNLAPTPMLPRAGLRRRRGFTLVELMVVVLVGAILMGLAVPALQNFLNANQLASTTDSFASALNLARSEAIKLATPVALANTSGGQDWSGGWTMFVDSDGNLAQNNGEQTVRVGAAVPAGFSLKSNSLLSTGVIEFDANGRLLNATSGQFIVCQGNWPTSGAARMVTVKGSGRVRIAANDASGAPLYDDSTTAASSCTP